MRKGVDKNAPKSDTCETPKERSENVSTRYCKKATHLFPINYAATHAGFPRQKSLKSLMYLFEQNSRRPISRSENVKKVQNLVSINGDFNF